MESHRISMLGTGLIGDFYTATLHGQRSRDRVDVVYSRSEERGLAFKERWGIPETTTDLRAAIEHPDTDVVVIGVPNFMHEEAVGLAAKAGKAVLCTKPLGRTADEARSPSNPAVTSARPRNCGAPPIGTKSENTR